MRASAANREVMRNKVPAPSSREAFATSFSLNKNTKSASWLKPNFEIKRHWYLFLTVRSDTSIDKFDEIDDIMEVSKLKGKTFGSQKDIKKATTYCITSKVAGLIHNFFKKNTFQENISNTK